MFGIHDPFILAAILGGGTIILLGVGTYVFQAGCALADVPERGYFPSLLIYGLAVILCVPAGVAVVYYAGTMESDPGVTFGTMRIAALGVALVVAWLLSSIVYKFALAASLRKGLLIAAIELILSAFVAVLIAGIVFVVLAVYQIIARPAVKAEGAPTVLVARSSGTRP